MVEKRVGPRERGGKGAKRSEKSETNTFKIGGPKKTIIIISSTEKRQERREKKAKYTKTRETREEIERHARLR